jgi:hypothetical protein
MSEVYKKSMWQDGFRVLEKACNRHQYSADIRRQRLAVLHFRIGECERCVGHYGQAFKRNLLAGFYDPKRAGNIIGKKIKSILTSTRRTLSR